MEPEGGVENQPHGPLLHVQRCEGPMSMRAAGRLQDLCLLSFTALDSECPQCHLFPTLLQATGFTGSRCRNHELLFITSHIAKTFINNDERNVVLFLLHYFESSNLKF